MLPFFLAMISDGYLTINFHCFVKFFMQKIFVLTDSTALIKSAFLILLVTARFEFERVKFDNFGFFFLSLFLIYHDASNSIHRIYFCLTISHINQIRFFVICVNIPIQTIGITFIKYELLSAVYSLIIL